MDKIKKELIKEIKDEVKKAAKEIIADLQLEIKKAKKEVNAIIKKVEPLAEIDDKFKKVNDDIKESKEKIKYISSATVENNKFSKKYIK